MAFTSRITLLAALAVAAFQAQAVNVTVAYQTSAEPAKVAQADNTFAKTSGATVDWRKFDSGASVVRALASGDVQIGNIGSSPLAVAASQQVPIEVFLLASKLGNSEALVVKKSITKPEDLIGKRIAEKAKAVGIDKVAFDRSGFAYHGRVKALADAAREAGLQF